MVTFPNLSVKMIWAKESGLSIWHTSSESMVYLVSKMHMVLLTIS